MSIIQLKITPNEFKTTLLSHGWFDLEPFTVDLRNLRLTRAFTNRFGNGVLKIFVKNNRVFCETLYGNQKIACQIAENCLSMDMDLGELYSLVARDSNYKWLTERGFGRYLRSPTLYEDCIKIVATVNQNWANTKNIIQNLIENFGSNINGFKDFPDPSQLIHVSESDLNTKTRCGYRAKAFVDIAAKAQKDPDFFLDEGWKSLQPNSFFDRLLTIRGMGPTSASYLCRIYGKPYNYSVDKWIIKRCDEMWELNFRAPNKKGKDKPNLKKYEDYLKKRYENFKEYGPSICWFEITKYWHDKDELGETWW